MSAHLSESSPTEDFRRSLFFMKKAVNLRDSENPLPHEHEATSFLFKKSSWAQTDHITLAAPIDSVAFQKKSIN
jgi:hypothetical protein